MKLARRLKQADKRYLSRPAACIAWIPGLGPAGYRSFRKASKTPPSGRPFSGSAPSAARLRTPVPFVPPLSSPARVVAATAGAPEELGEDGGPRGSSQTTRRRCPRARRVPRRQRRGLARGRATWASASLRFPGSELAASAGAAAAEAEAPARLSPPLQPKPGQARRPGWLEGGLLPKNGNSLHQDMETVQSPG